MEEGASLDKDRPTLAFRRERIFWAIGTTQFLYGSGQTYLA